MTSVGWERVTKPVLWDYIKLQPLSTNRENAQTWKRTWNSNEPSPFYSNSASTTPPGGLKRTQMNIQSTAGLICLSPGQSSTIRKRVGKKARTNAGQKKHKTGLIFP
ncbi:hypothetical protein GOODEAATRI_031315 [Goodea atripinnis]|uniref:ATP synthase F0 subunit 8 n=1 Tax=Goodea atripinnis TaxID=208336 RepID=A0ABV0N6R8_9TELE